MKILKKTASVILIIILILAEVLVLPFGAGNEKNIAKAANEVLISARHSAVFDAVYNFDGVATYANHTTEAKTSNGTAFAVLALEASSNDEFYVGLDHAFGTVRFDIAAAGAGVTLSSQYWNGAWTALTITDGTSNLTASGTVAFTAPSDWSTTAVNGVTKYWVRFRSPATNITTAPTVNSVVSPGTRVSPGSPLIVDILVDPNNVDPAKAVNSLQTDFEFDPTFVQVNEPGGITLGSAMDPVWSLSAPTINNIAGSITFIDGILNTALNTSFTFVTINMTAVAAVSGSAYLRLPDPNHGTTSNSLILLDPSVGVLPYIITNSSVVVSDDYTAPINQDTVFASSTSKQGGASVTIVSSGDATNNVWFAPSGTTTFAAGATMTTAGGTATSILAPATAGSYKLFVIDAAGNYSTASTATLTVDNVAPTADITYSDADGIVKSGDSLVITATFSEPMADAPIVKIAISGSNTVLATDMIKTDTTHYTYTHTVAAGNGASTVALSIGTDIAGNVITAAPTSGAAFTVDNTAPVNQDTVFAASTSKAGGAAVTIVSSGDATNNVWFAPAGTVTFVAGLTMTTAAGDATSILSPTTAGTYKLFVIDAAGNISSASTETLTVTSSAKNITSFNFASPSTTGTVNNTAHTVVLSVAYGTVVTALVPTIIISASATISPLSGVAQNFSSPVTYTVTAEDLTTQAYIVTVIVADPPSSGGGGGGPAPTPVASTVTGMSISINSGAPATNSAVVSLAIGAAKATKMAISNNADFSGGIWETFAALKSWTLISGDGIKTVYIKFQDAAGNTTAAISDTIILGNAAASYPDGTILKSSAAPEVYVIKSGQKEWIKTAADFTAGGYKWENLIIISPEALAAIPVYGSGGGVPTPTPTPTPTPVPVPDPITGNFPDGTLIKTSDSFRVYVIIEQKKKWISTPEVFETLGYKWTNIAAVSKEGLNKIADFEDNLIRTIGDYKVYLVVNGLRHHIPNPEIFLDYGFGWGDVKDVAPEIMAKYQMARLIRESKQGKIYYLSATGVKKWIPTAGVFNSYGNKWEDIQVISKKEMESYAVSNIMEHDGKLYLISGAYKKLIPTDAIFKKNKYKTELILGANQAEFDWYKTGSNVK